MFFKSILSGLVLVLSCPLINFSFVQQDFWSLCPKIKNSNQTNYDSKNGATFFTYGDKYKSKDYQRFRLRVFLTGFQYNYWATQIKEGIDGHDFFDIFFGKSIFFINKEWKKVRLDIREVISDQEKKLDLPPNTLYTTLEKTFGYAPWFNYFSDLFTGAYTTTYPFKQEPGVDYPNLFRHDGFIFDIPYKVDVNNIWKNTWTIYVYPQTELIMDQTLITHYLWHVASVNKHRPWNTETNPYAFVIKLNRGGSNLIKDNLAKIEEKLFSLMSVPLGQENYIEVAQESLALRIPLLPQKTVFFVDFKRILSSGVTLDYTYKRFCVCGSY